MTTYFTESEGGFTAEQRAGSKLDYGLDWSGFFVTAPGDTIASSTWATTSGLLLTQSLKTDTTTSVWVEVPQDVASDWYVLENSIVTEQGRRDSRVCLMYVKPSLNAGSPVFKNRIVAIAKLRRDSLLMAARGALPSIEVSDDYLWGKLRAAESEVAHELRVPLAPTTFFPNDPTPSEIAALDGMPWAIDAGYDYDPSAFQYNDKWGIIKTRNKPLISVSRVRFAYPGGPTAHYDLPLDWLRLDRKHGIINFVPSNTSFAAPLNAFVMQAIGQGRTIPLAIAITYVAGLQDVAANYPELLDAIMKKASLKTIEDAFLPQSGSISADGLSQSLSNDMEKHADTVERIINGGKGSNGGLMAAIHGIRLGVL